MQMAIKQRRRGVILINTKEYQKPTVTTVEIPERTAYACNLGDATCPEISNVVGSAICGPVGQGAGLFGLGGC